MQTKSGRGFLPAVISLALSTGLAFGGVVYASRVNLEINQEAYLKALENGDLQGSLDALTHLSHSPNVPFNFDGLAPDSLDERKRALLEGLAHFSLASYHSNTSLMAARFDSLTKSWHSAKKSNPSLPQTEWSAFAESADKYIEGLVAKRKHEHEAKRLQDIMGQNKNGYVRQVERFADLLNLPKPSNMDPLPENLYKSGVLAGLPILPGLPDELRDLVALREALDAAGGAVRIGGQSAPALFDAELISIREGVAASMSEPRDTGETDAAERFGNLGEVKQDVARTAGTLARTLFVTGALD